MFKALHFVSALAAGALAASSLASATPSPTSIAGHPKAGSTLEIQGEGFGPHGPSIELFEDFAGVSAGSPVSPSGPTIGAWSDTSSAPLVVAEGRSSGQAMVGYGDGRRRHVTLNLPRKEREIFVSFWVRVPPGTRFPGSVSSVGEFSSDSSWKFIWLMDTAEGFASNGYFDICLPTHTGGGTFQLAGNTYSVGDRYLSGGWWSWNEWMRISTWIRNPLEKSPGGVFEVVSEDKGYYGRSFDSPGSSVSHANQVFDVLSVPGWIREGGSERVRPLYDDIYVATGPAAAARVELANASRYEEATKIELLLVESWSDGRITVRVPRETNLQGDDWYLFVIDANGERNAHGQSLCQDCPKPPQLGIE